MATSTIKNVLGVETLELSLLNNFTLASWGYFRVYKVGSICIVAFNGLRRSTAVTSPTTVTSLPTSYKAAGNASAAGGNGNNDGFTMNIDKGSRNITVNSMNANTDYFGQLIFPIE